MGGNAKTTIFLKECLADALIRLLKDKPMEDITVKDIVETANIGRSTYFRHFTSKEEMLIFKLNQLWYRWAEEHEVKETRRFSLENASYFFEFLYSNRDLHVLLNK